MSDSMHWQENHLMLQGPSGTLETTITLVTPQTRPIIGLICHPHPLYGGTMQNKVVTTIARAFRDLQVSSVRFNYRGVGKSDGKYADGIGETEDALAIIHWIQQQWPDNALWLSGFSFGAYVSLAAAVRLNSDKLTQLISIAPAVNHTDFSGLLPTCPWLIVQGEKDEIVPANDVIAWAKQLRPSPKLILLPKATHFFDGQLLNLRQQLVTALTYAHPF